MSGNGIPVIKFMFREELKVLKEALSIQPGYEVEEFSSANDLSTFLSTINAGLIVTSLKDKNDLIQIATFMKIAKKVAKDTPFKVVVFNFSGDKTFEKAIAKLGIQDLVEPGINTKALKFKLDFWMKSLNAQIKNNPGNAQKSVKALDQKAAASEKKADAQAPVWQEPLDLEDDIWILKNDSDCKKILSKWLIKIVGPGPYVGSWVEVKANHWRFDIKESEKDLYVPGSGAWFFTGDQKPDFVWKENVWLITGDNFDLYYKDANQIVSRLKSKDKNFTICKNSLFAKTKEAIIAESFDKELVFKREAEQLEDLEGKNKTDQLGSSHLSGKNKSGSNLGGNLAGEVEGKEAITHDNLTQKTKTAKESKFWNGKNAYEQDGADDGLSAKADDPREGSALERERKDLEHQKYYKNHNEAEKYDPVEQKERERAQKEATGQSGPLRGKSSTDELDKNYDNSRSRESESAQKKEREAISKNETEKAKAQSAQKEKNGSVAKDAGSDDLDGKSSTDKLSSHYGRSARNGNEEAQEKERKEKEERNTEEREGRIKEERSSEKERPDLSRAEKEQLEALKRASKAVAEQAATRKNETEEQEAKKTKTSLEKNWEGQHDYEMSGESSSDKSKVLPFNKAKEEKPKPKTEEEKELDAITRDAKVISFLTQNNKKIECNLDDFFEETIIFHTENKEIRTSGKVSLDLMFKFLEKDSKLNLEGNVVSVEGDGEGMNYVTVQVTKENANALGSFMRLYEIRQENVNEFLKKVKGL